MKVKNVEMGEKYLKSDLEVKSFQSREELQEYLDFRKSHDVWVEPYINECAAVGIENIPLFLQKEKEEKNIVCSDVSYEECISDCGMFLTFPYENKMTIFPSRYTAAQTIRERAGLSGPIIINTESKSNCDVLPVNEKANWLSRGFSLHKDICKILIRDEKVGAMRSKEYEIIPADEIIPAMENQLLDDYSEMEFIGGSVSHEYLTVDYALNDAVVADSFKKVLEEANIPINGDVSACVSFATSDVGNSAITLNPIFIVNGTRVKLTGSISVRHDSGNTVGDFVEKMKDLNVLFKESEDRIEELGNIDITYPGACLLNIATEYKLPLTAAQEVANDFDLEHPTGCNAIDVYIALNEIVSVWNAKKTLSPTALINLSEQVAKTINADYEKSDHEQ